MFFCEVMNIHDILSLVSKGKIVIPGFKRSNGVYPKSICKIFNNIATGFPVGCIYLWEGNTGIIERPGVGGFIVDRETKGYHYYIIKGDDLISCIVGPLLTTLFDVVYVVSKKKFEYSPGGFDETDQFPISSFVGTVDFLNSTKKMDVEKIKHLGLVTKYILEFKFPIVKIRSDYDDMIDFCRNEFPDEIDEGLI